MPRLTLLFKLCVVLSSLTACANFPEVVAPSRIVSGPAPQLVPIDGILAQADTLRPVGSAVGGVQGRAAALRARAARMRRM